MRKKHGKITFKEYNMGQITLPMDPSTMIPENHLVRVVNTVIERKDAGPAVTTPRR